MPEPTPTHDRARSVLAAFDPSGFRDFAHGVVDALAEYLDAAQRSEMAVLPVVAPDAMLARWPPLEADADGGTAAELLGWVREVVAQSNHLHHPRYIGHQVAATVPAATVLEMVNALLNNGMAVYEMGQVHTIAERRVVEFLGGSLGLGAECNGVLTHGGSLGNLTALLAARQAMAGFDVWSEGSVPGPEADARPMAVLVSEQAHYCVGRAVQVMGWGGGGVQAVATDAQCRLDVGDLPRALHRAQDAGRQVVAVVASACSTATGSFDPIGPIADFCKDEGLWLHVDGAHGASLALSDRHRHVLAGIERADSVVWDLHKMMGLPALNTAVLFRDGRRSYESFAQEAGYLFEETDPEAQWFNLGQRTMECTKRGMGLTAYLMVRHLGARWFAAQVDALMERTVWLESLLREANDFEVFCAAEANILCFRHRPAGLGADSPGALDAHQARLRRALLDSGAFYIVQTRLRGALWLRTTVMNPLTTRRDLMDMLAQLRAM